MSIERERYEQMMQRMPFLKHMKRIFLFPPLPRKEPPATPPSGGTSASPAPWKTVPFPGEVQRLMPSETPPARLEPSEDQIRAIALDLEHAIQGPARTAMGYVCDQTYEYEGVVELHVDGGVDLIELAKAAIKAVRSHGL